jgi:ABC-type phosphate transport system substrate-binding protein
MHRRTLMRAAGLSLLMPALLPAHATEGAVAVIGHIGLKHIDAQTVKGVYTGRIVELDGLALRPVNLPPGMNVRGNFLLAVMQQSEADYLAYWTVRRYVGKGTPPPELPTTGGVIEHVLRTPGAIGYVSPSELRSGLSVLLQR